MQDSEQCLPLTRAIASVARFYMLIDCNKSECLLHISSL